MHNTSLYSLITEHFIFGDRAVMPHIFIGLLMNNYPFTTSTRLRQTTRQALEGLARRRRISPAAVLRYLIEKALANEEQKLASRNVANSSEIHS